MTKAAPKRSQRKAEAYTSMTDPVPIPPSTVMVIFGAGGDLSWRKLLPALFDLFVEGRLPDEVAIIGLDRKEMSREAFLEHVRSGVQDFARHLDTSDTTWSRFAGTLSYASGDFGDSSCYANLAENLRAQEAAWGEPANFVFYLATPPSLVGTIVEGLGGEGLAADRARARVVIEKPFGRDLASARTLDQAIQDVFLEEQIYRIDHYLGKETVQNILAFRFANALFDPVWDRRYIDNVQITVAETVGVAHRGGYYEHAGALRDMVQNHLMQLLCLVAMEPPVSFEADEIRSKKVDVLHAVRPIDEEHVEDFCARGQYGPGLIKGERVPGYHEEEGVAPDSSTETYAALTLFVDNWRWQAVPFYLRSGKRLQAKDSEVVVTFKDVPHRSFPNKAAPHWQANRIVINIQPDEGIALDMMAKRPGLGVRLSPVEMAFKYETAFQEGSPEAYETLLLDVMLGDATLFMRADQVEAAWRIVTPVLEHWEGTPPQNFPNYAAGTWGPEEADVMLERCDHDWKIPSEGRKEEARVRATERVLTPQGEPG